MLANLVIRLTAMGIVGTSRLLTGLRRQIALLGRSTFLDMQRAVRAIRAVTSAAHGATKAIAGVVAKPIAIGSAAAAGGIMLIGKEFGEADANARSLMATMMRTGGQVPESFKQMKDIAERLGETLPGTNSEFFRLANIMKGQGLSDNSLLAGGLEAAAKLGVVLRDNGVELEEAAESMAKFKNSLAIDDKDLVSFADTVQRIVKAGVGLTEVRYSIAGIASLLPKLRWTGLESAKNTATLSMMLLRGGMTSGETVGSGLNSLILKLASKGNVKRMNRELRRFKGEDGKRIQPLNFYDSQGNFVNQEGMVRELAKLSNLSLSRFNAIAGKFMGDEGGRVARLLGGLGPAGFAASKAELEKQADLDRRIKVLTDGLLMKWEASQGAFSGMLVKAGEVIEPELHKAVEAFGTFSEKGKQWLEENKPMLRAKMLGFIASLKPGFDMLTSQFTKATKAFGTLLTFIESISKIVGDFQEAYDYAPKDTQYAIKSMNPTDFIPAFIELNRIRKKTTEWRERQEGIAFSKQLEASWLSATKGSLFDQKAFSIDTVRNVKDSQPERKDKLIIEFDTSGFPRVKAFEQGRGPLREIETRIYNGKNMPQAGG